MDGQAACIHLQVDDDQHGQCMIGRHFPAGCEVLPSGAVGCACYVGTCDPHSLNWEQLRVQSRWRAMVAYYMAGSE